MARKRVEKILEKEIEKSKAEEPKIEEPKIEEPKEPEYYMLGIGETLENVAKKFNTTVEKLRKLNEGSDFIGGNQVRVR